MSPFPAAPFGRYAGGGRIGQALALLCGSGMESTPEGRFVALRCEGGIKSPISRRWMPPGNEWQHSADLACHAEADHP